MLVNDLYDEQFDKISDPKRAQTIDLLKDAINDWPTDVRTVGDFVSEVELFLQCQPITAIAIEHKLSNAVPIDAWKIESLTSIQMLITLNDDDTFENIIKEITQL